MNIPEELARRESRLDAIVAAKAEIERRAAQRFAKEQEEHQEKVAAREAKEKATGKKPRGRTPKPPQPGPKSKDQVNLTDSESRIMPSSSGGFEQSYNVQAAVDVDSMLIVENHITQQSNDKLELAPAVESLCSRPDSLGVVDTLLADAGYFSQNNGEACKGKTRYRMSKY